MAYLSDQRLLNLNGLLYVFNKKKTTTIGSAKEIMRVIFQRNAEKIYKARPSLFDNIQIENTRVIENFTDLEYFAKSDLLKSDFYSRILNFVVVN